MLSLSRKILGTLVFVALIAGCSSTPSQVEQLSSTANPTAEIQKTEKMLKEARDNQVNVLSPEKFSNAEKSLKEAIARKEKNRSPEEILKHVSYSRAWLKEAETTSEIAQTSMKDISAAREGALNAEAPKYFKKDWDRANDDLKKITHSIEKGNLKPSDKKGSELIEAFRDLERNSIAKKHLGVAKDNLDTAVRAKADKNAPKTYKRALAKYEATEKYISANPKSLAEIEAMSKDATLESRRLLDVSAKVNAGNSEDLVLRSMQQERQISNLQNEYSTTESKLEAARKQAATIKTELSKKEELDEQVLSIRSKFRPNEAEVFVQNGNIVIRLKGVQFASASTRLTPTSQALLSRVDAAITGLNPAKIMVEGHTDSVGRPDANLLLSEARAKSVENYLSTRGTLERVSMEVIGRGAEEPISDNNTASGRAQNRRIDLVIETL